MAGSSNAISREAEDFGLSATGPLCNTPINNDTESCIDEDSVASSSSTSAEEMILKTPKRKNNVVKLIDSKRKHLEINLSSAQRDQILINEAKEDAQFRKDLTQAIRESTESFSTSIKEVSDAMRGVGTGISQSVQMLTNALLQQQQPVQRTDHQNMFYQQPFYHNNVQSYYTKMMNSQTATRESENEQQ